MTARQSATQTNQEAEESVKKCCVSIRQTDNNAQYDKRWTQLELA